MAIAPTPEMKDYLEQLHTGTEGRVMPTGLPADSFYPDEKRALGLRRKLAGDKRYLFCTVARLAKEKNLEFLLQSVKMFKEAFGDDFRLALVGDGPYRAKLEAKTTALGLRDEVVFVGKVPNQEIKDHCCASDLFLFPSLSETQGIVLLEAMAAGTPVLALRATGTEDVVVNGRNGYMTEATEGDFVGKLMEILEKKELDLLRQGARLTAEGYRCERIAQIAIAAYKGAILNRAEKERRNEGLRRGKTRAKEVWQ